MNYIKERKWLKITTTAIAVVLMVIGTKLLGEILFGLFAALVMANFVDMKIAIIIGIISIAIILILLFLISIFIAFLYSD